MSEHGAWNKGKKMNKEWVERISQYSFIKGQVPHNKDKPMPPKVKERIKESLSKSEKNRNKRIWNKGLTKENEPKLKAMGKKHSSDMRNLFAEGKLNIFSNSGFVDHLFVY